MTITHVTSVAQYEQIIAGDEPAVFDFWAEWCGPCKMISPEFEALAGQFQYVKFYKVDVDACPDVAAKAGVTAMPTFVAHRKGAEIKPLVGASKLGLVTLVTQVAGGKD